MAAEVLDKAPEPQQHAESAAGTHPNLPDPTIATLDYAMQGGMLSLDVRAANAAYLLQRWFCRPMPLHAGCG